MNWAVFVIFAVMVSGIIVPPWCIYRYLDQKDNPQNYE